MNRSKLFFAGGLLAVLGLLVFGSLRLMRSFTVSREARELRDAAFSRLDKLYQADPFPDAGNAARMNGNVQSLEQMRAALTNALALRDVLRPDQSPSRFIQELQTALRDRLQARAPIVEGSRVIPDNFAFGFERYVAANAPMPAEPDVPRLAQQLVMVENLVNEVYAAQVNALRGIERELFDEPDAGTSEEARGGGRSPRAKEGAGTGTDLYRAQRFRLVVEGRQSTIGDLLNRLAAMPMFVIVRDVELRKKGDDLRPPASGAPAAAPGSPAAPAAPLFAAAPAAAPDKAAPAEEPVSSLPPSKRLVSGREIDPPIEARIELDVCNFNREGV